MPRRNARGPGAANHQGRPIDHIAAAAKQGISPVPSVTRQRRPADDRRCHSRNWRLISEDIRFGRAGGRCECAGECGSGHHGRCEAAHGQPHPVTGSVVWLQTAHLDRNPWNNDPANLRAMCAACHLAYDRDQHRETAAWTRAGRPDQQLELFPATAAGGRRAA